MVYTSVSGKSGTPKSIILASEADVLTGFQADTRRAMPGYGGLLFVYSIFLIPVVFSFLVGLNILVWSRSRINYVFIFGKRSNAIVPF